MWKKAIVHQFSISSIFDSFQTKNQWKFKKFQNDCPLPCENKQFVKNKERIIRTIRVFQVFEMSKNQDFVKKEKKKSNLAKNCQKKNYCSQNKFWGMKHIAN